MQTLVKVRMLVLLYNRVGEDVDCAALDVFTETARDNKNIDAWTTSNVTCGFTRALTTGKQPISRRCYCIEESVLVAALPNRSSN